MIAGVLIALLLLLMSGPAQAQTPTISSRLDAETLRDLPTTDNLFSVLETTQPSIVSDRFSAGLYVGQPARVSSFFSSYTETVFRLGDVDLTDPSGSGQPLLVPDLSLWEHVDVATGLTPIETGATGLAVGFEPRRPAARWTRTISGTRFGATEPAGPGVPPIVRPDGWSRVSAAASGPLLGDGSGVTRLAGYFAGSSTRGAQFFRAETRAARASTSSGFALLVFTPSEQSELQTIGWVQQSAYPLESRVAFGASGADDDGTGRSEDHASHLQATWERHRPNARRWRLFASYTRRDRQPTYAAAPGVIMERLRDGSPSELASLSATTVSRWSGGLRWLPAATSGPGRQSLEVGVDVGGTRQRAFSFFSGLAGELVDGTPARIWQFAGSGTDSIRHATTLTAFITDRIALAPRLRLDVGVRIDRVSGSASGASTGLRWRSLLPRAGLEWTIARGWDTRAFVGVGRSASRLPLELLAIGDPAAPTADVFQWLAPSPDAQPLSASLGQLVARVGPGTGGDRAFSRIASGARRPITDEFVVGLESHLGRPLRLRVVGFARRQRNPLALVNVGVPLSAYSVVSVPDAGLDLLGTGDDQLLPFYNRLPSSFGQDRYELTNPEQPAATSKSFEISGEFRTSRLTIFGGATASMAEGSAANRGFGPLENDQSRIGELLANPNANTFPRGRLFTDRAYIVRLSGVARFPLDIRLGAIVRYQDGQPFSRLVVLPTLNQGAEAVRAFPNGGSRFTYTETVDARLQKGFGAGGERVVLVVDAFNILKKANEVEERVVTGADFRTVTAVQPPRTLHVGLRLNF